MKNTILCLLLLGVVSTGHSQILLKEAKVEYIPLPMKMDFSSQTLTLSIPETRVGEFQRDPLFFVKNYFDMAQFIVQNQDQHYDSYEIDFRTKQGYLLAKFDKKGQLKSSFQKFKNVPLPDEARLEIFRKYRNSEILSNRYTSNSRGWDLQREVYRVKIRDGEKIRRIRIEKAHDRISLVGL